MQSYSTRHSTSLLLSVISNLKPEEREIVSDVGFGSLLDLKCSFTPKALVSWLASNFDCSSNAITLSNGFSFKLTPDVVHKVLGIPIGGREIACKSTSEASAIMKKETNCSGDSPTINELVELLSSHPHKTQFIHAFLLLCLSSFLCPTTHGHASPRYFYPLIEIDDIKSFNWSLLVFDWLIHYLKRYQQKISFGKSPALGGCTFFWVVCLSVFLCKFHFLPHHNCGNDLLIFIIQVCYLEFLKSPEIQMDLHLCPRLKFWTTSDVTLASNLDMYPIFPPRLGRLPVCTMLL